MLKLRTNQQGKVFKPAMPQPPGTNLCTATYDEYKGQRELIDVTAGSIEDSTARFKTEIADPLVSANPKIAMGEYFVIPVDEIQSMISSAGQTVDFIHIYNAVKETTNALGELKTFPVVILVPVTKQTIAGKETFANCSVDNTEYVEAFPCPPASGCPSPVIDSVHQNVIPANVPLNNFNSLF